MTIRMGEFGSDVYVIGTDTEWVCCSCSISPGIFKTIPEMVSHLRDHQEHGDVVPDLAFKRMAQHAQEEAEDAQSE